MYMTCACHINLPWLFPPVCNQMVLSSPICSIMSEWVQFTQLLAIFQLNHRGDATNPLHTLFPWGEFKPGSSVWQAKDVTTAKLFEQHSRSWWHKTETYNFLDFWNYVHYGDGEWQHTPLPWCPCITRPLQEDPNHSLQKTHPFWPVHPLQL